MVIILHDDVRLNVKPLKHTIQIDLDLLTSNGLIISSCYHDFNDTTHIVNISV